LFKSLPRSGFRENQEWIGRPFYTPHIELTGHALSKGIERFQDFLAKFLWRDRSSDSEERFAGLMDAECVFRGCVNEYFTLPKIDAAGSHGSLVCADSRFTKWRRGR